MSVRVINADMREALREMASSGVLFHSAVTDPPYHLTSIVKRFGKAGSAPAQFGTDGAYARASRGFMGKEWDGGDIAFQPETWRAVYDGLLPGAHLLAFGGTRTYHRLVCAIEDAGFEIRDQIGWMFGSGFPKSHDVSKGIDKAAGAERRVVGERKKLQSYGANDVFGDGPDKGGFQIITAPATPEAAQWAGWGTALKPAWEPIVVARKPLIGSVAANVLAHGTGALNIDACRVGIDPSDDIHAKNPHTIGTIGANGIYGSGVATAYKVPTGRWPANIITDGSQEVEEAFAAFGERGGGFGVRGKGRNVFGCGLDNATGQAVGFGDSGSASRFFYSAKADKTDRAGSRHPTVKPTDLMRYLVQLVTPPGGTVLDPFAGSGSTGLAADQLGMNAVLIERDPEYAADIERKIISDAPLFAKVLTA